MGKQHRSSKAEEVRVGPVRFTSGRSRAWVCLAISTIMLGLAVVCWGLHDKLSLYTPVHARPVSAKAKLLSEAERPSGVVAAATLVTPGWKPVAPVAALLTIAAYSLMQLLTLRRQAWCVTSTSFGPASIILVAPGNSAPRPPPALV